MQMKTSSMDANSAILNAVLQQKQRNKATYKAALYLRLSRDDNNGNSESMSIQSQREMLLTYAKENGYEVEGIYVDDGVSGTTYDRPEFKRMINDIELGRINLVITKDLSRFGRNYILTGQFTDYFFPKHDVRFIAINDNYDTNAEDNDIAPFKNILNEMYAKDISKKIRSSRKVAARQGKFMGSIPPYGYKRSTTDKHKLVPDKESSVVVKRIFHMYKNHESARYIADVLNREGLPTPQDYYYNSMGQENPYKRNAKTWCSATVLSILRNEVYLGRTVQSKRAVKSFKTKEIQALPPEMWVIVDDTHEALIGNEEWNAVQSMLRTNKLSKTRKTATDDLSLFANIARCGKCRSNLSFSTSKRATFVDYYYRCSRYNQHGKEQCTPHRIKLETLSAVVLEDVRNNAWLAKQDEEVFIRRLHKISLKEKTADLEKKRKREALIRKRLAEIDNLVKKSFEKNVGGVLPDDMLANLLGGYQKEKAEIEAELSELQAEMFLAESQAADMAQEVENLKQYAEITELNRKIVTNLIQAVYVSESIKINGQKVYDIEIRYKFQSPFATSTEIKEDISSVNEISSGTCNAVSF